MYKSGKRCPHSIIYEVASDELLPNSPPSGEKLMIEKRELTMRKQLSYTDGVKSLSSPDFLSVPRSITLVEEVGRAQQIGEQEEGRRPSEPRLVSEWRDSL